MALSYQSLSFLPSLPPLRPGQSDRLLLRRANDQRHTLRMADPLAKTRLGLYLIVNAGATEREQAANYGEGSINKPPLCFPSAGNASSFALTASPSSRLPIWECVRGSKVCIIMSRLQLYPDHGKHAHGMAGWGRLRSRSPPQAFQSQTLPNLPKNERNLSTFKIFILLVYAPRPPTLLHVSSLCCALKMDNVT